MKVYIDTDGVVTLDVSNGEAENAIEFIALLQAEKRRRANPSEAPGTGRLNQSQYDAWEFLCEEDCVEGVEIAAVARHLKITTGAAGQRVYTLMKKGYAKRLRNGVYRALTPAE